MAGMTFLASETQNFDYRALFPRVNFLVRYLKLRALVLELFVLVC